MAADEVDRDFPKQRADANPADRDPKRYTHAPFTLTRPDAPGCSTNLPVNVRNGDAVTTLTAGLSVFRIGDDGKLTFVRRYDIDVGDKIMFWMGIVPLLGTGIICVPVSQHSSQIDAGRFHPRCPTGGPCLWDDRSPEH
jgi:hypothetical protein